MRESVNLTRLSIIVRSNLEKEADNAEYTAASAGGSGRGDVQLHHPDAELDFEEQAEEGVYCKCTPVLTMQFCPS